MNFTAAIVTIATAIVGLATVAVVLSKNADTKGVIGAGFSGFSTSLGVALTPITGGGGGGGSAFNFGSMIPDYNGLTNFQ